MEYCIQDYLFKLDIISLDEFYCCICCKRGGSKSHSKKDNKPQFCSSSHRNRNGLYCMCLLLGVSCKRCRAMDIASCGNQRARITRPVSMSTSSDTDETAPEEQSDVLDAESNNTEIEGDESEPESEVERQLVSTQPALNSDLVFSFRFFYLPDLGGQ